MRIAIFGSGGVGGYFGGKLAQLGAASGDPEVIFIARGAHLAALRANGLRVDSILGNFSVQPVQASEDFVQVGEVDAVLVAVKTWQVPAAAASMRPLVGKDTLVVPLMNGVDSPEQLSAELGDAAVAGGMCRISALIAAPGHIRHVGIEPYIAFGELDGRRTERVEKLREVFERAGVRVEVPADIRVTMWEKFAFIAAFSGVGGVTRAPAGVLRSLPETRQLLEQAIAEIIAIARAKGVNMPENAAARTMATIDNAGPAVMASMQRDIIDGRPSELEAQNGAVVRMGSETGVPTPLHTYLYASLLPQEKRARGEVEF
jgi:2-dehydropantoate 2-reductase